ncbi:MAG: DUF2510 domain-containing protein [Eggerthellaceae bacterium]|jgi:hypothetical protein|nr:DUF2510 domain-containing protein [Eggerthellaceae bacterium]
MNKTQGGAQSQSIPNGWYTDPQNPEQERWWDSKHWTINVKHKGDTSPNSPIISEELWWEGLDWHSQAPLNAGADGHGGWYLDPSGEAELRWWDGTQWLNYTTSKEAASMERPPKIVDRLPAIKEWKPAPLFSALGLFVNLIVWNLIAGLYGVLIAAVAQTAIVIAYSLIFYRSYFMEKPVIISSKAISFLNYAASSLVFGWCWNRNLKKSHDVDCPKKGASYIVAIVLFSVLTIFYGWYYYLSPYAYIAQNYVYDSADGSYRPITSGSNTGYELIQAPDSLRFVDEEYGVSFSMPEGWSQEEFTKERQFLRWKAHPENSSAVGVAYGVEEGLPPIEETTAEDFQGIISSYLSNCSDEEVERTILGGTEYWKISGSGIYKMQDAAIPTRMIAFFSMNNGNGYMFQYMDFGETLDMARYRDFESLVASATYK